MTPVSPATVRRWRDRWGERGVAGLVPLYLRRRAQRVRAELLQLMSTLGASSAMGRRGPACGSSGFTRFAWPWAPIQRVFRDLGLPCLRRTHKRMPRQLKRFERPNPAIASRST